MHIPKWLIATAGLFVVGLIAALAFFIGRETSRPPAAAAAASSAALEPSAARASAPEVPRLPPAEAADGSTPIVPAPASGTVSSSATPSRASATSMPGPLVDGSQATAEARGRVAAYFEQMDAIQSGGSVGDQQEFATTLVNGAASGDFSGIDDLVRAAGEAERRAAALQPPAECAEYHRQALALLRESRTMVAALRDGLKRNDTDGLTALGASAQSMKSRAEDLAQAEKSIRARFGL